MQRLALAFIGLMLALISPAMADDDETLRYFRIGTGSAAGTDFPIGQAIAAAISSPPGSPPCNPGGRCGVPGLIAMAETTGDAMANFERVESGLLSAALVRTDLLRKEAGKAKLRYIGSLYSQSFYLVAHRWSGITKPDDLVGKKVAVGRPGSGTRMAAQLVLGSFGVDPESFTAVAEDPGTAADMLAAGDLDAFFFVGGQPAPVLIQLADRDLIQLVPLDGASMERLTILSRSYNRTTIPKEAYGLATDTTTLGVVSGLIVREDADDDLVYAITRALWDDGNRRAFSTAVPGLAAFSVMRALDGAPIPLHPGAARYYVEAGLIEPAEPQASVGSQSDNHSATSSIPQTASQ